MPKTGPNYVEAEMKAANSRPKLVVLGPIYLPISKIADFKARRRDKSIQRL